MNIQLFGNEKAPTLLLIPGLGVSYEIFFPLIRLLDNRFRILAVEVDGFTLGKYTRFTSVDDQAAQIIAYVRTHFDGHLDGAYGLSLGGKILSRMLERNELTINHAIMDAAPLLPLPKWSVDPLRYYQAVNVWTCYQWTGFWKRVFHSHYFDVLLDECKKVWPFGGKQAVLDGYKSVYTNRLEHIYGDDIHFWYGTKEAFVAKPQAKHLLSIYPNAHIQVFDGMNHGQLLVDHPEEVAKRMEDILKPDTKTVTPVCYIFDLDGTLLNTIDDLGYACNYALEQTGFPTHPIEAYPAMVGNGINNLIRRALPETDRSEETILRVRAHFVPYYDAHNCDYTRPYQGIPELLGKLKQRGCHLAVASNKYQAATEKIVEHFFPCVFDVVLGEREGIERKPNPQIVYDICSSLESACNMPASDLLHAIVYVGDSLVDRDTATNANVPFIACSWGFVPREKQVDAGIDRIVDSPAEIIG